MNTGTPAALDGLLAQLLRRGLPADYAQRAVAELADHHEDLVDELRAAGDSESRAAAEAARRLGEARTLVKKTAREYQRRYWCGRRPLVTFLLGPIPLMILAWLALTLIAFCIIWPLERMGVTANPEVDGIVSPLEYWSTCVAQSMYLLISPALVLLALAWRAKRAAMGSGWVCLSAGILAVFASLFWIGFAGGARTDMPADQGMLMLGLPMLWHAKEPLYLAQFLLPLGIAGVLLFRARQLALRAAQLAATDQLQGGEYEYARSA